MFSKNKPNIHIYYIPIDDKSLVMFLVRKIRATAAKTRRKTKVKKVKANLPDLIARSGFTKIRTTTNNIKINIKTHDSVFPLVSCRLREIFSPSYFHKYSPYLISTFN